MHHVETRAVMNDSGIEYWLNEMYASGWKLISTYSLSRPYVTFVFFSLLSEVDV